MNAHLQRALMLLDQSRHEMAEDELRQVLVAEPNNALAHAVMAICLSHREKFSEAQAAAQTAIHLSPDQPFMFYAHSLVLAGQNQFALAQQAIETAIGMDPQHVDYWAQLAQLEFNQRRWPNALRAAEQGLKLDPEDVNCTNLRAMALVKLGRNIEAKDALDTALKRAPEDEYSHANLGWSLLEQNQPEQAMQHFREALRLNPEMEWARSGIVEAMKARYFVYRLMLNWFLWMLKLQQKAQWGVIIGAYIGYRVLSNVVANNPGLAPWLRPLLIAYVAFAVMTWIASPMFNLVLRTSKFGRLALSKEEVRTSNWVGLCVLGAVVLIGAYAVTGAIELLGSALACMFIIPPLGRIYSCQVGWPRAVLSLVTLALGFLALVVISTLVVGHALEGQLGSALLGAGALFFTPFLVGAIAAQLLTNFLVAVQPRRGTSTGKLVWWMGGSVLVVAALLIVGFIGLVVLVGLSQPPLPNEVPADPQPAHLQVSACCPGTVAWASRGAAQPPGTTPTATRL